MCEKAVEVDAAAVIMASHGKGRLKEFFIGSVTNYCLHRCKKPVIICRKPADHFIAAAGTAGDVKEEAGRDWRMIPFLSPPPSETLVS